MAESQEGRKETVGRFTRIGRFIGIGQLCPIGRFPNQQVVGSIPTWRASESWGKSGGLRLPLPGGQPISRRVCRMVAV